MAADQPATARHDQDEQADEEDRQRNPETEQGRADHERGHRYGEHADDGGQVAAGSSKGRDHALSSCFWFGDRRGEDVVEVEHVGGCLLTFMADGHALYAPVSERAPPSG
jgi:hypothetical protein